MQEDPQEESEKEEEKAEVYDSDYTVIDGDIWKYYEEKPQFASDLERLKPPGFDSLSLDKKEAKKIQALLWFKNIKKDGSRYVPIQHMYYLLSTNPEMISIEQFEKNQGSDNRAKLTNNYKIHLMPAKESFIPSILTVIDFINNTEEGKHIKVAKVKVDYLSLLDKDMENKDRAPGIVLYVPGGKDQAQAVLNKLFTYTNDKELIGAGIRPRFNAQVNDLIYIAQGDANHKEAYNKYYEQPDKIYYDPEQIGEENKNYHLEYPDKPDVEIIEPERPADTYPDSGKGKEKA